MRTGDRSLSDLSPVSILSLVPVGRNAVRFLEAGGLADSQLRAQPTDSLLSISDSSQAAVPCVRHQQLPGLSISHPSRLGRLGDSDCGRRFPPPSLLFFP